MYIPGGQCQCRCPQVSVCRRLNYNLKKPLALRCGLIVKPHPRERNRRYCKPVTFHTVKPVLLLLQAAADPRPAVIVVGWRVAGEGRGESARTTRSPCLCALSSKKKKCQRNQRCGGRVLLLLPSGLPALVYYRLQQSIILLIHMGGVHTHRHKGTNDYDDDCTCSTR